MATGECLAPPPTGLVWDLSRSSSGLLTVESLKAVHWKHWHWGSLRRESVCLLHPGSHAPMFSRACITARGPTTSILRLTSLPLAVGKGAGPVTVLLHRRSKCLGLKEPFLLQASFHSAMSSFEPRSAHHHLHKGPLDPESPGYLCFPALSSVAVDDFTLGTPQGQEVGCVLLCPVIFSTLLLTIAYTL